MEDLILLELFSKNGTLPIVLQKNASLSVRIAAKDLQRNLLALSGKQSGFSFVTENGGNAREICAWEMEKLVLL